MKHLIRSSPFYVATLRQKQNFKGETMENKHLTQFTFYELYWTLIKQ